MSILIDSPQWTAHGRSWAHLVSDTSVEELHRFAAALGIPRRAFEGDHYDVPADVHHRAVAAGAEAVTTRELLARLRAAGLRRPKRRGEEVVASTLDAATGGAVADGAVADRAGRAGRVDVVRARRVPTPHGEHLGLLRDPSGEAVRTRRGPAGPDLPPVPWHPHAVVLGFRRTWSGDAGRRRVVHDGLLDLTGAPLAGRELPGDGWTPLADVPRRWWWPLLGTTTTAAGAPRRG
ncbi:DUF4031 domain-containing protein [Kineococcus glutinatus]|uniref:DUF4031 domain-containing protein n=1 Tax=Kineococcus glutinatus TaxID=1070872 RepID=A0ABP9H3X0_9ACTN